MGGSFCSVATGADAVIWNPARIMPKHKLEYSGNYAMLFSVDGLSCYSSAISMDFGKFGTIGLGWNRLALKDVYAENLISFCYAHRIVRNFSIGVAMRGFAISADGYEKYNDPAFTPNKIFPTADLGISWKPAVYVNVAMVMSNINSPEVSLITTTSDRDYIERNLSIGTSITIKKFLLVSVDAHIVDDFRDIIFNIGTETLFFNALALRSGLSQGRLGMGVGLFAQHWAVDLGFMSHRYMGNKYQFSLKLNY